jgi:hypothetical protein
VKLSERTYIDVFLEKNRDIYMDKNMDRWVVIR